MRILPVLLIALALALAGCSSKGGDGDGKDSSSSSTSGSSTGSGSGSSMKSPTGTSSSSGSSTGTGTTGPGGNRAPTAQLAASAESGTAPLAVNFTLNGTDADGNALTWTLSFGDASANQTGSALPATVLHEFALGSYNATLVVSDGKLSANATVHIVVAAGGNTIFEVSGTTSMNCLLCSGFGVVGPVGLPATGAQACVSFHTDMSGGDCVWFELPANVAGKAFTSISTGGDPDVEFGSDCSAMYESLGFAFVAGNEAGTVPAGAGCVFIWEFEASDSTHTFSVTG